LIGQLDAVPRKHLRLSVQGQVICPLATIACADRFAAAVLFSIGCAGWNLSSPA